MKTKGLWHFLVDCPAVNGYNIYYNVIDAVINDGLLGEEAKCFRNIFEYCR